MKSPPSSSRFALPSLTRPLRGAVPILYLAQDPHRRRAHNSVHRRTFVEHRRTFVEHRRTLEQSTGGAAHYTATTTARRRRRQRSGEARFTQGILSPLVVLSANMKVCYKPGFSITDRILFNNAHLRNLAIGNIFHVYKMDPERNSESKSVYPRGALSSILIS